MPAKTENGAPPRLLLRPAEAAEALGVSEKTLWSLTAPRGPIRALRIGARSIRYSVSALQAWIDQQQAAAEVGATA